MKNKLLLFALMLVASITACSQPKSSFQWRESLALTESLVPRRCITATSEELAQLDLATRALEFDDSQKTFMAMKIGAAQTLGYGIFRWVDKEAYPVCLDKGLYDRIGIALARQGGLGRNHIVEYELQLALKITNPPEVVVDDVARVAFAETPWRSETFVDEDIRPLARAILASYRGKANKYGIPASLQMSSETALGTGAAQIAIATRQPGALEKTLQMMDALISRFPAEQTIPWHTKNRLYELAWALTYTNEKTAERVAVIERIMSKKVQSNATMFGMVDLSPKKMCSVFIKISASQDISKYPYCLSDEPYDQ